MLFKLATVALAAEAALAFTSSHVKKYPQEASDASNPLRYMAGIGPHVEGTGYGIDRDPPDSCTVDQVYMLMRHGERFPSAINGEMYVPTLDKLNLADGYHYNASLYFLNDWTYPVTNPADYEQETTQGPYAGLGDAYVTGQEYRLRYDHLWDGQSIVPIFSSGYQRVVDTARKFGQGFFGYNYSTSAAINVISEATSQGLDSLTPTCLAPMQGVCNSLEVVENFPIYFTIFEDTATRLNATNPELHLNSTDIYNLMQIASWEVQIRGESPWVDVFTNEEWITYGYLGDLMYYFCFGPGQITAIGSGSVLANASLTLMQNGPEEDGSLHFGFVHDADITPVLAALGVLSPKNMSLDRVEFNNPYKATNIVPMGGRMVLERMSCNATATTAAGVYVRVVLNEAVIPYDDCQSGPGFSCPFDKYVKKIEKTMTPNVAKACDIPSDVPQYVAFYWDYNTTQELNYPSGPVPYQATTNWV
jgi:acid phosphatase